MEYISENTADTLRIAEEYAETLKKGDTVLLSGDLGAGKTEFIKGVCKYYNISGVTSPTYAYLNVYGDFIYHFDFYRLSSEEDAEILGLADYFGGDNLCLVEWGENVKGILPENAKRVIIEKVSETERKIIL